MLFVLALALMILTFILAIHYLQHFRFQYQQCIEISPNATSDTLQTQATLLRTATYTPRCCFALKPIDDEEFDFFPLSFLLYVAFMISLCILMITTDILHYINTENNESIIDLLFGYSLESYHNNSLFQLHAMNTTHLIDYILIYGIMVLSVWVSLFSFYRYYTTLISTKTLSIVSTKQIFKKFAVYALLFCIIFTLQIHIYYYLFPVIIFLFSSFNFFCCFKFAAMLVKHYNIFIDITINDIGIDILNSVLFTKNTSLLCCCIQSISLSIFVITYNVNILYYLPILWSISSFVLSLNFVRNYTFLQKRLFVCKQRCICIWYRKVKTNTNNPSVPEPIDIIVNKYHNFDGFIQQQTKITGNSKSLELYDIHLKPPSMQRAQSDPLGSYHKIQERKEDMDEKIEEESVSRAFSIIRKQKALDLLGITPISPSETIEPIVKVRKNEKVMKPPPLSRLRELSGLSKLSPLYRNRDMDENETTPEPTSPLALHLNVTPLVDTLDGARDVNFDVPSIDKIEEQRSNSDIAPMTAGSSTDVGMDIENKNDNPFKFMFGEAISQQDDVLTAGRIHHEKSHSEPQKLDEMFLSLDILAKNGFCSRQSILSVKQLTEYTQNSHGNKESFIRSASLR